jgi:hypothetical protein
MQALCAESFSHFSIFCIKVLDTFGVWHSYNDFILVGYENEILKMVTDAKDLKINLKFDTSDIESLLYSSASLDITEEQCDVKHKSIIQKKAH